MTENHAVSIAVVVTCGKIHWSTKSTSNFQMGREYLGTTSQTVLLTGPAPCCPQALFVCLKCVLEWRMPFPSWMDVCLSNFLCAHGNQLIFAWPERSQLCKGKSCIRCATHFCLWLCPSLECGPLEDRPPKGNLALRWFPSFKLMFRHSLCFSALSFLLSQALQSRCSPCVWQV